MGCAAPQHFSRPASNQLLGGAALQRCDNPLPNPDGFSRRGHTLLSLSTPTFQLFLLLLLSFLPAHADVLKIVLNDAIHPISAEYIARGLDAAAQNHDQAVLIEINTPGGLLDSTRNIIEKMTASPVPVIIYVDPSGSRAASAGIFILESADIAAMAPGTNTGAAHPVALVGGRQNR